MKKLLQAGMVLLFLCCFSQANAQSYLVSKTLLDSIKPYTFHGAANLGMEFKQADSKSFSLNAGMTLLYPTNKNQLKLSGNIAVNLLDGLSNDNKGWICFSGMLDQFKITDSKREKTPFFYDLYASYNYDFVRDLHSRVMAGMNITWQPLREHPHLCLEPFVGLMFSFQSWQVLNPGNGPNTNLTMMSNYNEVKNLTLSDGSTINDYLKILDNGRKYQLDPRINAGVHLFGIYNNIEFSVYFMVHQPLLRPFNTNATTEQEIEALVSSVIPEGSNIRDYVPSLNNKCIPEVLAGGSFSVKIYKGLSIVTLLDFLYDGGQLSNSSRNITYGIRLGFAYAW